MELRCCLCKGNLWVGEDFGVFEDGCVGVLLGVWGWSWGIFVSFFGYVKVVGWEEKEGLVV